MAVTSTKNYAAADFPELIQDFQNAYKWHDVVVSEDGNTADFYATESVFLRVRLENSRIYNDVRTETGKIINFSVGNYFSVRFTQTSKIFCISMTNPNIKTDIKPGDAQYIFAVGSATNQLTGTNETAIVCVYQSTNSVNGCIISADDLTDNVALLTASPVFQHLSAKVTTMQNFFSKFSECIMDDVYILTSSQLPAPAYGDCTFNGRKFYMQGVLLLADDQNGGGNEEEN